MKEPITSPDLAARGYALFAAQQEIDDMIRAYVDELVTSRGSVESHVSTFKSIFESLNEALVVFDEQGRVVLENHKAIALTGRNPQHITADSIESRYKRFKLDGCTPVPREEFPYVTAAQGHATSIEMIVYGGDLPPEGMTIRLNAAPIKDEHDHVTGVVMTIVNITENKRLEQQRNAFATLIAHDIKNHLAATDATLGLLGSDLKGKLDASTLELVADLKKANQHFLDIANSLLELYRTDLYELESCRVSVDIAEILQGAIALNSRDAHLAGVSLHLDVAEHLPPVQGIPAALRQAFHNLIQNGIEASKPGSAIQIKASTDANAVKVTVTDQGGGMPEETASRIFDRKRAAENVPTATTSTGFGLYLSRTIFEAHSGRITCQSHLGEGTTFTVGLPVSPDGHQHV